MMKASALWLRNGPHPCHSNPILAGGTASLLRRIGGLDTGLVAGVVLIGCCARVGSVGRLAQSRAGHYRRGCTGRLRRLG